MANSGPSKDEQKLFQTVQSFKHDPEGFVWFAFPWGKRKTPLEKYSGPRQWQLDEFRALKEHLDRNRSMVEMGLPSEPYYLSISSGRGPGKSAFIAMLNYWMASCWWGGTGIVTANTETQLRTRTMGEVGKWHTMAVNSHWFEKSSMSLRPAKWFTQLLETQLGISAEHYYVQGQSWSEENPDAFAGAHSTVAMMLTMDEASGIPDTIWDVCEGFFTDLAELRIWANISNPRRNSGKFFDCFHSDSEFWNTRYIDSRDVEGVDSSVYQRIADKNGEDSDVTRVEVKGMFPRTGSNQFIGMELVQDAVSRELEEDRGASLLMGVDVARFGNDKSVIRFRRGRNGRVVKPYRFKGLDTMQLATETARLIDTYSPDAVFIDGGGVGGGVVDRLKQLNYRVIEVQVGEKSNEPMKYMNKRIELWDKMREWLSIGCIPNDVQLVDDLVAPEYDYHPSKNILKLESKKDMKNRGVGSPDDGDALSLTFAQPVARRDMGAFRKPIIMQRGFNPLNRGQ